MTRIFNACYPQFAMTQESFDHIFGGCDLITAEGGFAAVDGERIRAVCVLPECRGKGIGTRLMAQAESRIRENGHDRALLGGVSSKFLIGADSRAWGFFERLGYTEKGRCDEMLLRLADFDYDSCELHGDADYGWYEGDLATLHRAVASVEEDWVKLFGEDERVYVGMVNGEIASFCQVAADARVYLADMHGRVGMPGCVGTVPEYRRKGIGLEMVARVTQYLKEQGMDISYIFYTGVAKWYEKLGYRTFMTEIFGEKPLTRGAQV